MDLSERVLDTMGGKPLIVLAKVGNRKCEDKKPLYFIFDECSSTLRLMSVKMMNNIKANIRNATISQNSKGLYEIYLTHCSNQKLPIIEMQDSNTIYPTKRGLWVLRRYRDSSGDTFDIVDQNGTPLKVTTEKLVRVSREVQLVNASINYNNNSVRGTMKPIPIIDITTPTKVLDVKSSQAVKNATRLGIVMRVDGSNLITRFKLVATEFNADLVEKPLIDNGVKYKISVKSDSQELLVDVENDLRLFFNCITTVLQGVSCNDVRFNLFVSNMSKEDGAIELRTSIDCHINSSYNKLERRVHTNSNIADKGREAKKEFIECTHKRYFACIELLNNLGVIDKRSVDKVISEYVDYTDLNTLPA